MSWLQVQPPSYGVRLEGAQVVRETEGGRLRPLAPDEAPSSDTPPAAAAAGLASKFDLTTGGKVRRYHCIITTSLRVDGMHNGLWRVSCAHAGCGKHARAPVPVFARQIMEYICIGWKASNVIAPLLQVGAASKSGTGKDAAAGRPKPDPKAFKLQVLLAGYCLYMHNNPQLQ